MNYDFNPLSTKMESKDEWKLLMWPYEENWAFSLYKYFLLNEQFLNGTEKCLDEFYFAKTGKTTKCHKSYLWGNFTKKQPEQWDTTWEFLSDDLNDPLAAFYLDTATGKNLWLCPLWTMMWGEKPQKLFATFTPDDDKTNKQGGKDVFAGCLPFSRSDA